MLDENRYPDLKAARYRQAIEDALGRLTFKNLCDARAILIEALAEKTCEECQVLTHHAQLRELLGKLVCVSCHDSMTKGLEDWHEEKLEEENRQRMFLEGE